LDLHHHVTVSGGVVFLGGWRGYRPLMRVSLISGDRLPFDKAALAGIGPSAWPLPVRLRTEQDGDDHAVLVAGTDRPALLVVAASGTAVAEWPLPAPIRFPDGGAGYRVSGDGRITFVSGSRTVVEFDPVHGVRMLWRHTRDIRAFPPLLDDQTLWLADDAGITVVDLDREIVTEVETPSSRAVVAVTRTAGRAWFAFTDGSLVAVDRSGGHSTAARVLPRIDRLSAGQDGLIHALGKGRITTFRA
ncbi:MAG TPA: hypothetical protein VN408_35155, partial [Actinoplanes sp.]|nr:hypothetical protein [Actinoplanes sp.]